MSNIVKPFVLDYLHSLVQKNDEFLVTLEKYALDNNIPIIDKEIEDLMRVLVKMNGGTRILEIGTAIGYSASIFAKTIKQGRIVTIERSEWMHEVAQETIENLKKEEPDVEVDLLFGDASQILENLNEKFDIIFIDASKGHYQEFFDASVDMLVDGGLIISDNVLYKGMVASDELVVRRQKTIVKRMRNYLKFLMESEEYDTTILPMSDGVAISYKNGGVK